MRNSLAQRFPVELLREIFYYCSNTECRYDPAGVSDVDYIKIAVETTGRVGELRRAYQRVPRWVVILFVCRSWYCAAIGYPDLWTRLDFSSLSLTKAHLRHSNSRPLDVTAFLPFRFENPDLGALQLIMTHFKRIRTLFLFAAIPNDLTDILMGHAKDSADALEELTLHSDFLKNTEHNDYLDDKILKLYRVLRGPMPRLRSVYIAGQRILHTDVDRIRRSSVVGPALRHLKLKDCRQVFGGWILRTFLEELEPLTNLKTLVLHNAISVDDEEHLGFSDPAPENAPTHVLQLPHSLSSLEISDDVAVIERFLEHVSIPPWTSLHLNTLLHGDVYFCQDERDEPDKLRSLCSRIAYQPAVLTVHELWHMAGWGAYVPHSLNKDDLGPCRFNVQFFVRKESIDHGGDEGDEYLETINDYLADPVWAGAVTRGLDLRHTHCIVFDHGSDLSNVDFYNIFAPAVNVHEISLNSRSLQQVLNVVGAVCGNVQGNQRVGAGGPPLPMLWPRLRVITIKARHRYIVASWSLLLSALANRRGWNIGIQSIRIVVDKDHRGQFIQAELIGKELARFVPHVSVCVSGI